jgi:hypothetical protein
MSSILKAFNAHLLDFITDIISVFPENKNLKITKTALETWKHVNPKSIIEIWKTCITDKYHKEIGKGDYDFFVKKNYTEDISGCENISEILHAIEKLRNPISQMSDSNQKKAVKYIQNLTKLSELYYAPS